MWGGERALGLHVAICVVSLDLNMGISTSASRGESCEGCPPVKLPSGGWEMYDQDQGAT